MNPEQLWETTMSPETRILRQVNIESAAEADRIFSMLMATTCRRAGNLSKGMPSMPTSIFSGVRPEPTNVEHKN